MDKSSGRETTDGPSDNDKTVAERVSLVVGAQYEHDRAEGALSAGANKYDVSGEGYQDVKDAMAILKALTGKKQEMCKSAQAGCAAAHAVAGGAQA